MEPKSHLEAAGPKAAGNPVMDVVTPPPEPASQQSVGSNDDPLEKLVAEDKADREATERAASKDKDTKKPAPKKPKQRQPGIGMAITATVIIVLGLAALATYAYLKTTG